MFPLLHPPIWPRILQQRAKRLAAFLSAFDMISWKNICIRVNNKREERGGIWGHPGLFIHAVKRPRKTNIVFSPRSRIVSPHMSTSAPSRAAEKCCRRPLGAGAQSNPRGRKWRGGVWMWHKQEASFVLPPAQRCTRKVYSKLCCCASYFFLSLSNTICFARILHHRHCWKTLTY